MHFVDGRVDSRRDFSVWMCELHNAVNDQIGKPTFPCDLPTLDSRLVHCPSDARPTTCVV